MQYVAYTSTRPPAPSTLVAVGVAPLLPPKIFIDQYGLIMYVAATVGTYSRCVLFIDVMVLHRYCAAYMKLSCHFERKVNSSGITSVFDWESSILLAVLILTSDVAQTPLVPAC